MRERKPCFRRRGIRLGCQVRFGITILLHIQQERNVYLRSSAAGHRTTYNRILPPGQNQTLRIVSGEELAM